MRLFCTLLFLAMAELPSQSFARTASQFSLAQLLQRRGLLEKFFEPLPLVPQLVEPLLEPLLEPLSTPCVAPEFCTVTCECKPDGDYPVPTDCSQFYTCIDGAVEDGEVSQCIFGRLYNPAIEVRKLA